MSVYSAMPPERPVKPWRRARSRLELTGPAPCQTMSGFAFLEMAEDDALAFALPSPPALISNESVNLISNESVKTVRGSSGNRPSGAEYRLVRRAGRQLAGDSCLWDLGPKVGHKITVHGYCRGIGPLVFWYTPCIRDTSGTRTLLPGSVSLRSVQTSEKEGGIK